MQIHHFARIAQNYAVPVSDFVRNHLLPNDALFTGSRQNRF
jgi:hypothetical protein